ncbi:MAG TPA: hypothetical protein VJ717_13380 [Gemmatimonadaceae bacterium]|nr:hypothetical protein [Gemmatimonadaceae bacterium]
MSIDRHLFRLLSAALALTVAACGGDRLAPPTGAVSLDSEVSSAELEATFNSEQARTANNAIASLPVYDSLLASHSADLISDLTGTVTATVNSLLLQCKPQPYASSVKTIGVGGGVLKAGPHTLVIPPGALTKNTVITIEAPSSKVAQVKFAPHGLKFTNWQKPVLTMSYSHCSGLGTLLPKKIVYTDDLLKILETLLSLDLPKNKSVSAPLSHFSSYVVAY